MIIKKILLERLRKYFFTVINFKLGEKKLKKIIFLISGNGGNFKFIHLCIKNNILKNYKLVIIADRECEGLNYAKKENIENYKILYNQKNNIELKRILKEVEANYIITNWNKIIDAEIVELYKHKLINLHYSLLPAFGGLIGEKPLESAMEKNVNFLEQLYIK